MAAKWRVWNLSLQKGTWVAFAAALLLTGACVDQASSYPPQPAGQTTRLQTAPDRTGRQPPTVQLELIDAGGFADTSRLQDQLRAMAERQGLRLTVDPLASTDQSLRLAVTQGTTRSEVILVAVWDLTDRATGTRWLRIANERRATAARRADPGDLMAPLAADAFAKIAARLSERRPPTGNPPAAAAALVQVSGAFGPANETLASALREEIGKRITPPSRLIVTGHTAIAGNAADGLSILWTIQDEEGLPLGTIRQRRTAGAAGPMPHPDDPSMRAAARSAAAAIQQLIASRRTPRPAPVS